MNETHGTKADDTPLPDETVEAMADAAERGYGSETCRAVAEADRRGVGGGDGRVGASGPGTEA